MSDLSRSDPDHLVKIQKAPDALSGKLRAFMVWRKEKKCEKFTVKATLQLDKYAVEIWHEKQASANGFSTVSINEAVDQALKKVFKVWLSEEEAEWIELSKSI